MRQYGKIVRHPRRSVPLVSVTVAIVRARLRPAFDQVNNAQPSGHAVSPKVPGPVALRLEMTAEPPRRPQTGSASEPVAWQVSGQPASPLAATQTTSRTGRSEPDRHIVVQRAESIRAGRR
jgi:hypothetical protein